MSRNNKAVCQAASWTSPCLGACQGRGRAVQLAVLWPALSLVRWRDVLERVGCKQRRSGRRPPSQVVRPQPTPGTLEIDPSYAWVQASGGAALRFLLCAPIVSSAALLAAFCSAGFLPIGCVLATEPLPN